MSGEIGLLVNGPEEWYINIQESFKEYNKTWLQQNKELKEEYKKHFNQLINSRGFFLVFGYVQNPHSRVMYRFKVDRIMSSHQRIPPEDDTAPPFSSYDKNQGGCKDENDFKYETWLRVVECSTISPVAKEEFINLNTKKPVASVRGNPHYYVEIPDSLKEEEIEELPPTEEAIGTSISLERDLETFIVDNLDYIEKGLKLYPDGQQYNLKTGKVDLLCVDVNDNLVVIELKTGTVGVNVIGQILSYIAAVQQDLAKNRNVRGIIIGRDFDNKIKTTVSTLPQLKLMRYQVSFKFEEA
ncbi:MAG: endonuclease NucS [Archaeoglobaceae archaeon]